MRILGVLKIVCGWSNKTWLLPYACCSLHFTDSAACVLSFYHSTPLHIYGRKVHIQNDHKPLATILKKPLSQASRRIQAPMMRFHRYDVTFQYAQVSQLFIADTLCRAFLPDPGIDVRVMAMNSLLDVPDKTTQEVREATPDGECQTTYFWRDVSVPVLSLFLSLAICLILFCFIGLFLRLSFIQILASVVLSFYHFEGSFHFWVLSWGLVLRPFSTCSSLMSLPLFTFLVASFSSGCFFLLPFLSPVLFCLGCHRAPFSLLCATFSFSFFVFHQALCLLVLFSPVCWAWIHSLFSFFSLGLFFGLPVFGDSVLSSLQGCFLIYWFVFLRLVFRLFSL